MNNKRGMALVVALMTSFILLALVASLFWIIASTSRQAEYTKNSAIALNLAEAGTADAIYRLNYEKDLNVGNYPFDLSDNPFGNSSLISIPPLPVELPSPPTGISYAPQGINGNLNDGYYVVGLLDDTTGPDTLIAVGVYKGIRRILTVPLRGNSFVTAPRQGPMSTQGISEAFNKHAIYAGTVAYTAGTKVNGNIASINADTLGLINTTTGVTKTKVSNIDNTYFPVFTPPAILPVPSWTWTYQNGNNLTTGGTFAGDGFGSYAAGTGTYTFTGPTLGAGTNLNFLTGAFVPTIIITSLNTINSSIGTTGNLTLSGTKTIGPGVFFQPSGTITVNSNTTINGDLIVEGVPLTLNNSNIIIRGAVLCDNAITLSGNASTINASTSTKEAAVLMESATGATVTISAGPTITLGQNQKAAVVAYSSGGAVGIIINANLIPMLSPGQAGIIAYAGPANATITIGSTAPANIDGLIYAYSSGAVGSITLDNPASNINGTLVANGTVGLNSGTLNYDSSVFIGASLSSDIFFGFYGGRKAYVPVWQGWRLE